MNKRRSEVSVAPLRPLALNRATEILPYRGTLFLKGETLYEHSHRPSGNERRRPERV